MSENTENKDETYVKPNIEFELPKEKRQVCRDIVKEIKDFGISQRQLLFLIQLLSLELENREVMNALSKAIGENRNKISAGNKLIVPEETKKAKSKLAY